MAVEHLKSTPITNRDATPRVINAAGVSGGEVRRAVGTVTNTAAASVASTYRYCSVPSSAYIKRVSYGSAAAGATGQVNLGVYQTAANGGAVVDADLFASALDPGGGAIAMTDVTHESGEYTFTESMTPLWQVLGLSADPFIDYDIATTVSEILADAALSKVEVEYVI